MSRQKETIWMVALAMTLVLITLPRFNRRDRLISRFTSAGQSSLVVLADAAEYIKVVEFFRGETGQWTLDAPFSYRPLSPLLASRLPLSPMTSLNVVNVLSLLLCLPVLWQVLNKLGHGGRGRVVGVALFTVSFPSFYYASVGIVDPVLVLFVMMGVLCLVTHMWLLLLVIIAGGAFVKESIVLLIPVLVVFLWSKRQTLWRSILITVVASVLFYLTWRVARGMITKEEYTWNPSIYHLVRNVNRPQTWLSLLLSLGIPGILSLLTLARMDSDSWQQWLRDEGWLWTGFILSLGLFAFSIVSAYSDGRSIWLSYPFTIPLAVSVIEKRKPTADHHVYRCTEKT